MMGTHAFEQALKLETERLCLDFTNTVNWHASEHPIEELPAYDDLVAWAQNVGLLTQPDLLSRVGECADDRGCGYLFLDMTKNRSRRWCDMKDCGNRAKARRHYEKQKEVISKR